MLLLLRRSIVPPDPSEQGDQANNLQFTRIQLTKSNNSSPGRRPPKTIPQSRHMMRRRTHPARVHAMHACMHAHVRASWGGNIFFRAAGLREGKGKRRPKSGSLGSKKSLVLFCPLIFFPQTNVACARDESFVGPYIYSLPRESCRVLSWCFRARARGCTQPRSHARYVCTHLARIGNRQRDL